MSERDVNKAGPIGRAARLVLALGLAAVTVPAYVEADAAYVSGSLVVLLGLAAVYLALHLVVSRYGAERNRWLLAVSAVLPVCVTWALGQPGGPLFGGGEGGTAALGYLTISFLVDFVRGYAGCEVMAVPSLITGTRTPIPCVLLCPIDHLEHASRGHAP